MLSFVCMSRVFLSSCCIFSVLSAQQVREARIISVQGCDSNWDASQMRELLYRDKIGARIVTSTYVNEGYTVVCM